MSNSVPPERNWTVMPGQRQPRGATTSLYGQGGRKYLNASERQRVLEHARDLPIEAALFVMLVAWSGARIGEVLALTPSSFQLERSVVAFNTLKRRRPIVREVPVLPELVRWLDAQFHLAARMADPAVSHERLWTCSRTTAWRWVKRTMASAGLSGVAACPRGLRHAVGVGTLQAGVPLNLVQRWLGHSTITTTAIYAAASGPEELAFAERFWRAGRDEGVRGAHHASHP